MAIYGYTQWIENRELDSCFLSTSSLQMDQRLWATLPDDVVLSIVAKLPWDEIRRLSCTFKKLREALRHQAYFEEYSAARLLKPICILHFMLHKQPVYRLAGNWLTSTFTVVAGNGHSVPHNLLNSKSKDVTIFSHDTVLGSSQILVQVKDSWAAGCFVLVKYHNLYEHAEVPLAHDIVCTCSRHANYRTVSLQAQTVWIVMNPLNGAARQISFPIQNSPLVPEFDTYRSIHSKMFVNGIFKDGDSHYQIMATSYNCNEDGHLTYIHPKEEVLGRPEEGLHTGYSRGPWHATFYLYKSRTKSWLNLLGSNVDLRAKFIDPVLYNGVIHAMLALDYHSQTEPPPPSSKVYYVGEESGRKMWMPLAVPMPSETLLFSRLFIFRGMLMLAAAVPRSTAFSVLRYSGDLWDLSSVCIWRLQEELKTWVVVSSMPVSIFHEARRERCCAHYWRIRSFCASGDYVMLGSNDSEQFHEDDCIVMCNIVASHWQMLHREAPLEKKLLVHALFEPRFDVCP